jgi:UDP-N-acetylmuramoyl-tripeptide--D-alanyl-D-alanine ligase
MTVTQKNHLIVDAYNANPTSMHAALDNFSLIDSSLTTHHSPLKKMVILGQMGELGDESDKEHRLLVDRLESSGYDEVWLVGDNFRDIPCPFRKFHDVEEVKAAIASNCPEGYYILIKGSNSNKLFQLPELL